MEDGIEDRTRTVAAKRQCTRRHLVQDDSEREKVGAMVEFLAPDLLRRHVGDCSQRAAGTCQMLLADCCCAGFNSDCLWLAHDYLGQAEVHYLGVSALSDKDVRRLDVAVDDAFCVCGVERLRDFDTNVQKPLQFHWAAADQMFQGCAVKELHRNEGLA